MELSGISLQNLSVLTKQSHSLQSVVSGTPSTLPTGMISDRFKDLKAVTSNVFAHNNHVENCNYRAKCGAKKEREKVSIKKKLKLLKGLSKNLSMFSGMSSEMESQTGLTVEMISEAYDILLKQQEKLKKKKKVEKSKMKSMRMSSVIVDSSSSSSSESECDEVVSKNTQLEFTVEENGIHDFHNKHESEEEINGDNTIFINEANTNGMNVSTMGRNIEVCMGGKCKKSGGDALLSEFQRIMGVEGSVVGCKCMGKCKQGPNVKIIDRENSLQSENALLVGVGVEDVGDIVTKFLGDDQNLNVTS